MSPELVTELLSRGIYLVILSVLVLTIPGLIVGLIVSLFQAATQMNEQTLSFLPRLITTFLMIVIAGPWLITKYQDFLQFLFEHLSQWLG